MVSKLKLVLKAVRTLIPQIKRPRIKDIGIGPYNLESRLAAALSPCTHIWPGGTTTCLPTGVAMPSGGGAGKTVGSTSITSPGSPKIRLQTIMFGSNGDKNETRQPRWRVCGKYSWRIFSSNTSSSMARVGSIDGPLAYRRSQKTDLIATESWYTWRILTPCCSKRCISSKDWGGVTIRQSIMGEPTHNDERYNSLFNIVLQPRLMGCWMHLSWRAYKTALIPEISPGP